MTDFEQGVQTLAAVGVRIELHRNESGQLIVDVLGEHVDGWTAPEGTWVTVVAWEPEPPGPKPL